MSTRPRVNKLKQAMHGIQADDTPAPTAQVVAFSGTPTRYPVTPSRVGKKMISGYFVPDVTKQLHLLGIERDTSIQALLQEALNDLFRKYGKSAIA